MSGFYTTHELAALLRVKERKVYDLVAKDTIPFRRVTGKLLFPRDEIAQWLQVNDVANGAQAAPKLQPSFEGRRPLVAAGGHDLLLEWALRGHVWTAPLVKGLFAVLRTSRARSCLRPVYAEEIVRWP